MNTAQHIIQLFTPLMAGVDTLCMIVLLRGGWPRPDEPRVRPTRIQLCLAVSLFFAIVYFLMAAIVQEWNLPLTNREHLLLEWISNLTLMGFLMQSVLLRQQPIRLREWLLALVPAVLNMVVILVWGNSHPMVALYAGYALYAYILIMYGVCLWHLRQWDQHIEEEYSDIAHKQTRWYRRLTMPVILLILLWIPAAGLPHGEWVWVIYYPLLTVVTIYVTSFALTQEEWEASPLPSPEKEIDENEIEIENETEQSSYEVPVWAERLERLMSERQLYHDPALTLTTLGRELGVNRTYLSQYINQVKGTTFYQYVNDYRLSEAKMMLRDTNKTIDMIAAQCGFSSANVFRRIFHDKYGLAPTDWRKTEQRSAIG